MFISDCFQTLSLLSACFIQSSSFDSKNIDCHFHHYSPASILKTSPELNYSDVLYFTSIDNSVFDCWDMRIFSTNQISVSDISLLYEDKLLDLHLQDFSSVVLYLSPENGTEILKLFTKFYQKETVWYRIHTILDWSYPSFENVKLQIPNFSHIFQLNNRLHILAKDSISYNFTSKLPNKDIINMNMTDVYSIKDVQVIETVPIKIYSITNPKFYTKFNFQGAVIRATAVEAEENNPVVTYSKDSLEPKFIRGLGVFDLWDVRDMLNFSVHAMKGDDDISVNKTDGFKPTGIGLQLFNDEADVSILHSYQLLDNARHLKPLLALGEDRVYAIFVQPSSSSVRNVFVKPFQIEVWIGLSVTWTCISIFVFGFVYLLKLCPNREYWDTEETVLWTVGVFCQRSFFQSPGSISLKILFISGLLFSMSIYATYSAEIISSLMAESHPIKSLTDLIVNGFEIISDPDKFYSYMLKDKSQSQEDYARELSKSFTSEIDSISSVTKGFKMHFNTLDSLYLFARQLKYLDSEICQLYHYVPLGFVTLKSGFYVQKNSPFQEPFNLKIVVIMERGLNHRYLRNYYEETIVKCPKTKKRYREDLGLTDTFTAFAILLAGILISFLCLATETYYYASNLRT